MSAETLKLLLPVILAGLKAALAGRPLLLLLFGSIESHIKGLLAAGKTAEVEQILTAVNVQMASLEGKL